jgi:hypothetical protein
MRHGLSGFGGNPYLPPGVTDAMIDRHFGGENPPCDSCSHYHPNKRFLKPGLTNRQRRREYGLCDKQRIIVYANEEGCEHNDYDPSDDYDDRDDY